MGSASLSGAVCGCSRVVALSTCHTRGACVWLVVWVGCGPYSGRFALLWLLTPGTPTHTKCVVLGVLLFVLAY